MRSISAASSMLAITFSFPPPPALEAERWRESHRRTKSLDKLIADDAREAQAAEAKREQRELGERAL